jgi:AcrR family transcriptional regulator
MKESGAARPKRSYRQTARAEAAAATGRRIIDAFVEYTHERWFDEITLEDVARRAGVTARSVIRRFGGKAGLINAMVEHRGPEIGVEFTAVPGDVSDAIARLLSTYEKYGDGVIRNLAQESRVPALQPLLDHGRKEHRRITVEQFAPSLQRLSEAEREHALDALVVATDVYTWKLLRRDMGRSVAQTRSALTHLVDAVLAEYNGKSRKRHRS